MLIGVTGTNGAGKGTLVDFLKQEGYIHISVRSYLESELQKQGCSVINRDSLRNLADKLRQKHGASYVVEMMCQEAVKHENVIIESIRCIAEIDPIKNRHGILLGIDADRKLRYERSVRRKSVTDHISYDEFIALEEKEFANTDPTKANLKECLNQSDFVFDNSYSLDDLKKQFDEFRLKYL